MSFNKSLSYSNANRADGFTTFIACLNDPSKNATDKDVCGFSSNIAFEKINPSQQLQTVAGYRTQAFATPDDPRDKRNGEPSTARIRDGSTPFPSDFVRHSSLHPTQEHHPTNNRVSDSNNALDQADEDADPKAALTVVTADDGEAILQLAKGKASEAFGSRGKF